MSSPPVLFEPLLTSVDDAESVSSFCSSSLAKRSGGKNRRSHPWAKEEDQRLLRILDQVQSLAQGQPESSSSWASISRQMSGRSGKQCRERYWNHLRPGLNKNPWTTVEDQLLMQLYTVLGRRWTEISHRLPGRSDNAIKNRFHILHAKHLRSSKSRTCVRKHRKISASKSVAPSRVRSEGGNGHESSCMDNRWPDAECESRFVYDDERLHGEEDVDENKEVDDEEMRLLRDIVQGKSLGDESFQSLTESWTAPGVPTFDHLFAVLERPAEMQARLPSLQKQQSNEGLLLERLSPFGFLPYLQTESLGACASLADHTSSWLPDLIDGSRRRSPLRPITMHSCSESMLYSPFSPLLSSTFSPLANITHSPNW